MAHLFQEQLFLMQARFDGLVDIECKVPFLEVLLALEPNEEILTVIQQWLEFYQHVIIEISHALYILQEQRSFSQLLLVVGAVYLQGGVKEDQPHPEVLYLIVLLRPDVESRCENLYFLADAHIRSCVLIIDMAERGIVVDPLNLLFEVLVLNL